LTYGLTCIARSIVSSEVEITGNIEVGDPTPTPGGLSKRRRLARLSRGRQTI
jgi:hypothetical protein